MAMVVELLVLGAVGTGIHVAYARLVDWATGARSAEDKRECAKS
jgi:hypothetical protein